MICGALVPDGEASFGGYAGEAFVKCGDLGGTIEFRGEQDTAIGHTEAGVRSQFREVPIDVIFECAGIDTQLVEYFLGSPSASRACGHHKHFGTGEHADSFRLTG